MKNTGYLHPLYAQSLSAFGEPLELPASKGWILRRSIPGTMEFDGMGCYPLFSCQDWSSLESDLNLLEGQLVSLSLVTDPFGGYNQQNLIKGFKDVARPYKNHYIVDLERRPVDFVTAHHQRNARRALNKIDVETCLEPIRYLDDWIFLYKHLIMRHNIDGLTRFSRDSFAQQLRVPGIIAFRAGIGDETIGMLLWYMQGEAGYYHLGAYNSDGYKLKVSFALFWTALEFFANSGLRWLNLGAGAGAQGNEDDGLSRFKRGWSTGTRTAFFCGRVFNRIKYREILASRRIPPTEFFPAYRLGEFQ